MAKKELPVIIREDKLEVVAIFPTETRGGASMMVCYSPSEGYTECSEGWFRKETRPASASARRAMMKRLRAVYSKARIVERFRLSAKDYMARKAQR